MSAAPVIGGSAGGSGSTGGSNSNSGSGGDSNSSGSGNSDSGSGGDSNSGGSGNSGSGSGGGSNSGGSGNSDSGTGGGNSGGGSTGGSTEPVITPELVKAEQTGLVDLGWAQYVVVSFAPGYVLSQCTLTVDGTDVTEALSKVDDEGTIVKWELTDLEPAELVVASKADASISQKVILSGNTNPVSPSVVMGTAPDYILTHGPVAVWDYHLTNYDDDGQVRVSPKKTTFALKDTSSPTVDYYAPDAEVKEEAGGNSYGVSGTVEILFNYNTDGEKAWFDAVAETGALALVAYDQNNNTLNDALTYTKATRPHYGGTVGVLTIPIGQSNFYANGRYYVRVVSAGHQTVLAAIHVVNAQEPVLKVSETGAIKSGQNVHFEVQNMAYGITIPIEQVTLTNPSGETKTLEKITDWYLLGNTLVLYNDVNAENGRNNIADAGRYTLTVYANGFKTVSKSFEVKGQAVVQGQRFSVDAVSRATGSGGGSSDGSGSVTMNADLLFNADLLINALILDELGIDNAYAQAIAERWFSEVIQDAVFSEDGVNFYDWSDYYNAVSDAKLEDGRYLTFAEYAQSGQTTLNRPYAVKEVLEDNLLGETQYNGVYLGKTPPEMQLADDLAAVVEGEDLVLCCADKDYLSAIEAIYLNKSWQPLAADKYRVQDGQLIIDHNVLALGSNAVVIKAQGYQDNTLSVNYLKAVQPITLEVADALVGQDVTVQIAGPAADFLSYLEAVTLDDQPVLTEMAGGSSGNDWYEVTEDAVILKGGLFETAGLYTVKLQAEYYGQAALTFEVRNSGESDLQAPLTVAEMTVYHQFFDGDCYRIRFVETEESDLTAYLNAVTEVSVGGRVYTKSGLSIGESDEDKFKIANHEVYGGAAYLDLTTNGFSSEENTEVVIKADGYQDLTFTVDKKGQLITGDAGQEEQPTTQAPLTVAEMMVYHQFFDGDCYRIRFVETEESDLTAYLNAVTEVSVGGRVYTKSGLSIGESDEDKFKIANHEVYGGAAYLDLTTNGFSSEENTEVVIKADGYQDLTFTVDKKGQLITGDAGQDEEEWLLPAEVPEISKNFGYDFKFQFTTEEAKAWLQAVSAVMVNGQSYEKTSSSFGVHNNEMYYVDAGYILLGEGAFSNTDNTAVIISAKGYQDLTFLVGLDGQLVTENALVKSVLSLQEGAEGFKALEVPEAAPMEDEDETVPDTEQSGSKDSEEAAADEDVYAGNETVLDGDAADFTEMDETNGSEQNEETDVEQNGVWAEGAEQPCSLAAAEAEA